jgi:glycosyltransferase involved in cell wall biosynthesis
MSRILMVLRPDRGGVFNHVARLSAALAAKGHEVALCGPLSCRRADLDVPVIQVEIPRSPSPRADLQAIQVLGMAIRGFKPDLIHAHGSQAGFLARIARVASPSIPLVFTPHLYAFANYFPRRAERLAYRLIEQALAPAATRVLCVCEAERRVAAKIGPSERTRVVHNGREPIRGGQVHPQVATLRGGGPLVCTIAELRASKGVPLLIEAMAKVTQDLPEVRLAIAGDGDDRAAVEARIRSLGLQESVALLGATNGPDGVLSGADLFVNPAFAEAFPYTVIEAMSAGLPIVATDVGGTSEAIVHESSGLLVPPHDAVALAVAILRLLRDPDFAAAQGERAQRRYQERFTLEAMVSGTLGVYAELGVG